MSPDAYTTDTSRDARDVLLRLLRRMPPGERARKAFALSDQLKEMALEAIRRRRSPANEDDVKLRFIELTYGHELMFRDCSCCSKNRPIGNASNELRTRWASQIFSWVCSLRAIESPPGDRETGRQGDRETGRSIVDCQRAGKKRQ